MAMIISYTDAAEVFAKARDPEKGKPLDSKPWRLFKVGDDFVFKCYSRPVIRLLPDNTLHFRMGRVPPLSSVSTLTSVLPCTLARVSTGKYRVHTSHSGQGYTLTDALVINMTTLTAVGYREPELVTDATARRGWLKSSAALKVHLKTLVRLGVLTEQVSAFKARRASRWDCAPWRPSTPDAPDTQLFVAALTMEPEPLAALADRLVVVMYRDYHNVPTPAAQMLWVDSIFRTASVSARLALGIISYKE